MATVRPASDGSVGSKAGKCLEGISRGWDCELPIAVVRGFPGAVEAAAERLWNGGMMRSH